MKATRLAIDDGRWRDLVAGSPAASPFHLPEWASVISDCYGFETFVLAVANAAGELLAGLPVAVVRSPLGGHRWVSLPFTDYCPPLIREGVEWAPIAEEVRRFAAGSDGTELEVRCELPELQGVYPVHAGYHSVVNLTPDARALHPNKVHRNIRNRALRQGITVSRGATQEDVDTYYRLHTLTRRRLGVPVQPRRFFQLIAERLIARGHGFVASAHDNGNIVASGLYLAHNEMLVAKFAASDPTRRDTGGGYLIDWEVMTAGCELGYRILDLGRSDPDADGLRLYKRGWGAVETPLVYTHLSDSPPRRDRPSVGRLSRRVISHSPVWVCRALGAAFYRWSA